MRVIIITSIILFSLYFNPVISYAMTNTPAKYILTNKVYMYGSNVATASNENTIEVASNNGGTFVRCISNKNAGTGASVLFTNIFRNDGNHRDVFQVLITTTNYSSGTSSPWTNYFERLSGVQVTSFTLDQGELFTNRVVIKVDNSALFGSYMDFVVAVQVMNPSILTNYIGDNLITYGGDLGDGPDGPGYINMISKSTTRVIIGQTGPYYVDDNGLDNNLGTYSYPFKTIQKAVNEMSRGLPACTVASCYVFPGTYMEHVKIMSNNNSGYMMITALTNTKSPVISGGSSTNIGFSFENKTSRVIVDNLIIKQFTNAIIVVDNASSNFIINNSICSNTDYGVYINSVNSINNHILTNDIHANQDTGICFNNGANNNIYRNLIRDNTQYGIQILNNSSGIRVINNTIVENQLQDGVYWGNNSTGTMYNNIIMSNGNDGNDYGVEHSTSGTVYLNYNDIYGNTGGPTNSGFSSGTNNLFIDPVIDTTTNYGILSDNSPVLDKGVLIASVSDVYSGPYPDMGWKEYTNAYIRFNFSKSISNVKISGTATEAIPGSSICYMIQYNVVTNLTSGLNVIIYDKISGNTTFSTNFQGTATGWSVEYSISNTPDQSYNSSHYTLSRPPDKTQIRWIRWKKASVGAENNRNMFYKTIIR